MPRQQLYFSPIVVGLLIACAVVGLLVGWVRADGGREWVLVVAGSAEFFGVRLVAAPELGPYLDTRSPRLRWVSPLDASETAVVATP